MQFVSLNSMNSDFLNIHTGLPQGSMISAPEFSIYVNEIFDLNLHGYIQMYADDAVVTYTLKN